MNQEAPQTDYPVKIQQILARCRRDDNFRKAVLADTMAALRAEGVTPPGGMTIKAVEYADGISLLTLPSSPAALPDEDLENVVGGLDRRLPFDLVNRGFPEDLLMAPENMPASGSLPAGATLRKLKG